MRGTERLFARPQDCAAYSASRTFGMNEEGADPRRIASRSEGIIHRHPSAIASEYRPSPAPTSTARDAARVFRHKAGAILDQLTINTEDGPECGFDLRGRIIGKLQPPRRQRDQEFQGRDIRFACQADCKITVHWEGLRMQYDVQHLTATHEPVAASAQAGIHPQQ